MSSAQEHAPTAKKSYSKPQCVSKSTSELALFLRNKLSAQLQSRELGPPIDEQLTPILLVKNYRDDSTSIQEAARSQNLHGRSCPAANGSGLVPSQRDDLDCDGVVRPDFLLLDLRFHEGDEPEVVREIRRDSHLMDFPLAVMTTGNSDIELLPVCSAPILWRMSGLTDPVQVAKALRLVLNLWMAGLKLSPSLLSALLQ